MTRTKKELDLEKLPTLGEVLHVEETIQNCDESIVTLSQLKKLLHRKITQTTLRNILDYLDAYHYQPASLCIRSCEGSSGDRNLDTL